MNLMGVLYNEVMWFCPYSVETHTLVFGTDRFGKLEFYADVCSPTNVEKLHAQRV